MMDSVFLEKIIVKGMLEDKQFLVLISQVYEKEYFDNGTIGEVFEVLKDHLENYNKIPPKDVIINSVNDKKDVKSLFEELDCIDYDTTKNYDHLLKEANIYLKEQAVKIAIMDSANIIDEKGDKFLIRSKIEDALCKDLVIDLGLRYLGDFKNRLKDAFSSVDKKVPTGYPLFDEMINGGFPTLSLSIIASKVHGMKSTTLANFAVRQVMNGLNVVLMTLEMSESAFAQRFDSIISLMDINRMYMKKDNYVKLYRKFESITRDDKIGEVFVKEFPTGAASVNDFRVYLRELQIRGSQPDILYVDYINLMKSAYKTDGSLYSSIKKVTEELRALSFEFKVPVVSVTQLNREGSFVNFKELDFRYIAESAGVGATADFMVIYGVDEDDVVYAQELHGKIVKNRFGRLDTFKFYFDTRTLKLYDESEMDLWISDGQITNDERNAYDRVNN